MAKTMKESIAQVRAAKANRGGSNTALTSIPSLTAYEEKKAKNTPLGYVNSTTSPIQSLKRYNETYKQLQAETPAYNEAKAQQVSNVLNSIGQTSQARQGQNVIRDELMRLASVTGAIQMPTVQNLTPEMQNAGLTANDLRIYNEQKNEAERRETAQRLAKEHPVLSTAYAIPSNLAEGLLDTAEKGASYLFGQPMTERPTNAEIIRQTVGQNINTGSDLGDKVAKGGYSVLNSIADMTLASLVGGGPRAAAAIMGGEKASSTMNDAISRGLDPTQIIAEGGTSALSTYLTEKLPLEMFSKGGNIFGSMLAEGGQEGLEDLVDSFFDDIITKLGNNEDKSAFNAMVQPYIEAGYTQEEAIKQAKLDYRNQVITDVILGGISGGVMGAGSNFFRGNNVITGKPRGNVNVEQNTETKTEVPKLEQPKTETVNEGQNDAIMQYLNVLKENVKNDPSQYENWLNVADQVRKQIPSLDSEVRQQYADLRGYLDEVEARQNAQREEQNRLDQLAREEYARRNDPETIDFLRNLASETANESQNWELPKVEQTTDTEDIDFLRNIASDISNESQNWEFRQPNVNGNIPAVNSVVKRAESAINTFLNGYESGVYGKEEFTDLMNGLNDLIAQNPESQADIRNLFNGLIETIKNPKQPEVKVSAREVQNAIYNAESMKNKLSYFPDEDARAIEARIDEAVNAVRESGDQNAIENLNNVVNSANEIIELATVTEPVRSINAVGYDNMKNVTDGRRIKVTPEMLKTLNLKTVTELNNLTNTGDRNTIKFFKADNPQASSLDSVYAEMRDMSNGELPDVYAGDQLSALVNYITSYKSGRNEEVVSHTWRDTPVRDAAPAAYRQAESVVDYYVNQANENKGLSDKEWQKFFDEYNKIYKENKNDPDTLNAINDIFTETIDNLRNAVYDEDIANIETPEQIEEAVANEMNGYRMNLKMFSNAKKSNVNTNEDFGRVKTGEFKTSKNYTNTGKKILTQQEQRLHELDDKMDYEVNHEPQSMQESTKRLVENGIQNEYERLLNKTEFNNVDVDEMFKLRRMFTEEALDLESKGRDATDAWQRAKKAFEKLQDMATEHGAGLQAYAKWSRNNTADGLLHQVTQVVNRFRKGEQLGVNTRREMKKSDFESQLEKLDKVKLTDEFVEEFTRIARQIEDMAEDGIDVSTDPRALEPMNKLGKMVNSLLPSSIPEKVRTYLCLCMLGNPRTLISRNAGGNVGFNLVEDFLMKPTAYLVDKAVSSKTGKQRIARPTSAIYSAGKQGFIYGLNQSIQDLKNNVHSARSGENNLRNAVANNRRTFTGPVMGTFERLVGFGLDVGDRMFYEKAYNMAIEEGKQLYKDGAFGDISEAEFNEMNKLHAMEAGLEAVYQDDTPLSDAFLGLKNSIGQLSKGLFGVDILSQFSMPFVKTPANIIYRSIEYSPLGLVKNAIQTIREVNSTDVNGNKVNKFNQERFSKETARNIVGSALFTIAMMMAKSGALTGGFSDNDKVKQAQKEAGMQEYALHTGNGDYDVSWLPVLGNNLYAAAATFDAMNDPELSLGESFTKGLSAGVGSQFSASMLQGLQRLFGANSYSNGTIADNMLNTVLSGTSQVVPSFMRQIAAVSDPYQRNTYGPGFFDQYVNNIKNSIPGLRQIGRAHV